MNRNEYIVSLIPLSVERKVEFMLGSVPAEVYMVYLKWMQDALMIESKKDSESIYVDIVRHIIVNTRTDPNAMVNVALLNGITNSSPRP